MMERMRRRQKSLKGFNLFNPEYNSGVMKKVTNSERVK
jgi:hypothetical protein